MANEPNFGAEAGAVQASGEQIADMVKQIQQSEGHRAGEIDMDALDGVDSWNQEAVLEALAQPPKIEKQVEDEGLKIEGIEEATPPPEKGKKQQPQRRELQELKALRAERKELRGKLEQLNAEHRQFQNYMLAQLTQQGQNAPQGQQQPQGPPPPPNYDKYFDPKSIMGEDGQIDPSRFVANYREYNQNLVGDIMDALEGRLMPLEQAIDQSMAQSAMQNFGQQVGYKQGSARKELADILFAAVNANQRFPKHMIGQANDVIAKKIKAALDEEFTDRLNLARKKKEEAALRKRTTPPLSGGGMGGMNIRDDRPDPDTIDEADTRMREFIKRMKAGS